MIRQTITITVGQQMVDQVFIDWPNVSVDDPAFPTLQPSAYYLMSEPDRVFDSWPAVQHYVIAKYGDMVMPSTAEGASKQKAKSVPPSTD